MTLLNIQNLNISFLINKQQYKAVDNISFSLVKGEILGIVGESGCGKSLTALSIIKLLPKKAILSATEMQFNDIDILHATEKEMRDLRGDDISMIFQEPMTSLNPLLKVGKQIAETVNLHTNAKDSKQQALQIMKQVGLPNAEVMYNQYPHELSGGMRQRIMIAMAMVMKPLLLIADEPTTALDVTIQAQILDLMKYLNSKFGTTIILISHDLGVIKRMCDRVLVMYMGNIVEEARVTELFNNAKHPYTKGLLAAIPNPKVKRSKLYTIPGRVPSITNRPTGCAFAARCSYVTKECKKQNPLMFYENDHGISCFNYKQVK
ncbi:ABC transporter ATP-binding protein [Clostridium sp. 'deep sea']|uniref:ABC transporter ATP-binding protein n=1 Tax=Clostridium sp. 'deep sea' TaxID=2779445 RepID=UPI0018966035|nr:ABC transporter ATP-binding protein [Clostridium sp. 'deep sea']QOR35492.1 ABC transporter ATP-binding protein [Clostridium sp. 'deep sea']